jgi:hypothetical protein
MVFPILPEAETSASKVGTCEYISRPLIWIFSKGQEISGLDASIVEVSILASFCGGRDR